MHNSTLSWKRSTCSCTNSRSSRSFGLVKITSEATYQLYYAKKSWWKYKKTSTRIVNCRLKLKNLEEIFFHRFYVNLINLYIFTKLLIINFLRIWFFFYFFLLLFNEIFWIDKKNIFNVSAFRICIIVISLSCIILDTSL